MNIHAAKNCGFLGCLRSSIVRSARESRFFRFPDEISQHDGSLAKGFQERRGVNVKTNDSGCKERDEGRGRWIGDARARGEKTAAGGAVTRMVAATRTVTIPFYFPDSLVSLARSGFRLLFPPLPLLFPHPRSAASETTLPLPIHPRARCHLPRAHEKVYLNVFRDRAICSYCSAFSPSSFDSSKVGTGFFVVIYSR